MDLVVVLEFVNMLIIVVGFPSIFLIPLIRMFVDFVKHGKRVV